MELKNITGKSATILKEMGFYDIRVSLTTLDGMVAPDEMAAPRIRREFIASFDRDTTEIAPGESRYYEFKEEIYVEGSWDTSGYIPHLPLVQYGRTYKMQITWGRFLTSNVIEWTVPLWHKSETVE